MCNRKYKINKNFLNILWVFGTGDGCVIINVDCHGEELFV